MEAVVVEKQQEVPAALPGAPPGSPDDHDDLMDFSFEIDRDWMQTVGSLVTLKFRDVEVEKQYMRVAGQQTKRRVFWIALGLAFYSLYSISASDWFHIGGLVTRWQTSANWAYNITWLFLMVLGLSGMCMSKGVLRDLGPQTERFLTFWICVGTLVSLLFGNRWRCGQIFNVEHSQAFGRADGSQANSNFVTHLRGYSNDTDLVVALTTTCAYFSFYTPLRFTSKIVIDMTMVASYALTTLFLGAPPGDPKFALIIGLVAVTSLTLFGHRALEVNHRQNFLKFAQQEKMLNRTKRELARSSDSLLRTQQEADMMQHRAEATEAMMKALCDVVVTASSTFTITRSDGRMDELFGQPMTQEPLRAHLRDAPERARFERVVSVDNATSSERVPPKLINLCFRTAFGQDLEAEVIIADAGDSQCSRRGSREKTELIGGAPHLIEWRYLLGFRVRTADGASPPQPPAPPHAMMNHSLPGHIPGDPSAPSLITYEKAESLMSKEESQSIVDVNRIFKNPEPGGHKFQSSNGSYSSQSQSETNRTFTSRSESLSHARHDNRSNSVQSHTEAESMSIVEVDHALEDLCRYQDAGQSPGHHRVHALSPHSGF